MNFTKGKTWHNSHASNWAVWLSHLAGMPTQALEVGSFEGLSATWMLEHVLMHPDSRLTCYDCWWKPETEQLFDANIVATGQSHKVTKRKGNSVEQLRYLQGAFDVVYIDACHEAKFALTDTILAWPRLKRGGIMIWDDYQWTQPAELAHLLPTKPAIDAFLHMWGAELEVLHTGWQVVARKL